MTIRIAQELDTTAIVQLLKESLGETLLKKTDIIWQYKHQENPFGSSYVLLAEENGQLIGVRAFMSWNWQTGGNVWQAYRAVDTATHPEYQGKGIFKKLTLQALEDVGTNTDCFIFNTPNSKSKPGYLKMGWQELWKIRLSLVPVFLFIHSLFYRRATSIDPLQNREHLDILCQQHNEYCQQQNVLFTPKSSDYLTWRYATNPMQRYFIHMSQEWYVACYVKKHRYFNELRVAECIGTLSQKGRKELQRYLVRLAFQHQCLLLTTADKNLFTLRLYGTFGPMLTCNDLTASQPILRASQNPFFWKYSLGDLELF